MDSSRFEVGAVAPQAGPPSWQALGWGQAEPSPAEPGEVLRLRLEAEHLRALAAALLADLSNQWTAAVALLELSGWQAGAAAAGPHQATLERAVQASARLLRAGTKAFVRYQRPPREVHLDRLLAALSDVLASRLPSGARLAYHLDEGLPGVQGDDLLLSQLIDELVSNAAESVRPDSTIRIAASRLGACPPYEAGRYLRCYRFVGPALVVAVSWSPAPGRQAATDSPATDFFSLERLLAIQGGLHLDLSLALHLDEPAPGTRTARLLLPLGTTPAADD